MRFAYCEVAASALEDELQSEADVAAELVVQRLAVGAVNNQWSAGAAMVQFRLQIVRTHRSCVKRRSLESDQTTRSDVLRLAQGIYRSVVRCDRMLVQQVDGSSREAEDLRLADSEVLLKIEVALDVPWRTMNIGLSHRDRSCGWVLSHVNPVTAVHYVNRERWLSREGKAYVKEAGCRSALIQVLEETKVGRKSPQPCQFVVGVSLELVRTVRWQ